MNVAETTLKAEDVNQIPVNIINSFTTVRAAGLRNSCLAVKRKLGATTTVQICQTCGRMLLRSLWKHVFETLRAMSGLMLKNVRVNSWTAMLLRSVPTANGAKPVTHALKLDCMASKSWFSSSSSNPPK